MPKEAQLALGRIFRLMSRPSQPGDIEQYEAARAALLDMASPDDMERVAREIAAIPSYVRDRLRGAAGD